MRIVLGIGHPRDASDFEAFLSGFSTPPEVLAISVVPASRSLQGLEDTRERLQEHLTAVVNIERASAAAILSDFAVRAEGLGISVRTFVVVGDPTTEIFRISRAHNADLIVVKRRRGEPQESTILGRTANQLAGNSVRSVLLLDSRKPVPRRILVATDGSRPANRAASVVRDLGMRDDTTIYCCAIAESVEPMFLEPDAPGFEDHRRAAAEAQRIQMLAAEHALSEVELTLSGTGIALEKLPRSGDIVDTILQVAEELDIDLITLGAKGVTGSDQYQLGGVTRKLLNRVSCSLLVARTTSPPLM